MRRLIQGGLALPLLIVLLSGTAASVQFTPLVVINEVAWAGTAAEAIDEWIELCNTADEDLDLTGWKLKSYDGWLEISLSGTISAGGFFLLERSHDNVISNIPADQVYQGILRNSGERLYLYDPKGNLIDTANGNGGNWPAGTDAYGSPPYASMERIHSKVRDRDENWTCNDGVGTNGHDAQGNPVRGTPKAPNSAANLPPIADFSFQPGDPTTQEKIQFTDESRDPDGEIARWYWDFGDGTSSSEQNPQHRYGDDGTYTVQVDCS